MNKAARCWPVRAGIVALVGVGLLIGATSAFAAVRINGAGATFPALLYGKWSKGYKTAQINYNAVGSGSGVAQIENGTVNFGASDKPQTMATLNQYGLIQFPSCIGGVVAIVHVGNIASGRLKLTGPVLAKIFEGKITKWNSSAITKLNPGLKLPSTAIKTFHRSDTSGTTWIFTHYLKAVDSSWPFADWTGGWPTGSGVKGSALVAAEVKQHAGSIGYVEYSYALTAHIAYAQLKNRSGKWVLPSTSKFAAAAAKASWSSSNGFATNLVNMKGASAWPITGATYILLRKSQSNKTVGHDMLGFFNWGFTSATGKADAKGLDFVSMPSKAVTKIKAVWKSSVKSGGKPCWP
jgi:phosphate transport system substrate-binding protein